MIKKIFLFIKLTLVFVIPFQLIFLYGKNTNNSIETVAGIQNQQTIDVKVTATIGDSHLNLYGYTSPQALVTLEGMGILDHSYADNEGYFQFSTLFSSKSSREACLSSKDQLGRSSSPVCLPPFPAGNDVSVGPVIMPPTISLNSQNYYMGDQVILSGQAVPNTEVSLSMFGDNEKTSNFALIRPVEAFTFPELKIKSDNKGNFSINLPSSNPKKFRLFAQANFMKSISANSINLNFDILPIWMIVVKYFLFFISLLYPRLLEIVILFEIGYVLYTLKNHFHEKAIIIYQGQLPMVEASSLPSIISTAKKSLIEY